MLKIGIHSVSSQSGSATFADLIKKKIQVYGYARKSEHGQAFVNAISTQGGIYVETPRSKGEEACKLIPIKHHAVGHSIKRLVSESDIIIITHPSQYLKDTIMQLKKAGIQERAIPIILSPSRTFIVPYLWRILGEGYPFICFSTCPYSCKSNQIGKVYIKKRKRNWMGSLEGHFKSESLRIVKKLYPQAIFNHVPATTSIGNIGAVFHPGPYLLNYEAIQAAEKGKKVYSFYMAGIAKNKSVAGHIEAIDQIRLQIASHLKLQVFGLREQPNEERWAEILDVLRSKEKKAYDDLSELRQLRQHYLIEINEAVMSAQHWLDYTYGVTRIPGEGLDQAIARTSTYKKRSRPQSRYVEEDIPTGIVPLRAIAKRFDLDTGPMDFILELHKKHYKRGQKKDWRDLKSFSTEYITDYLQGKFFKIIQ
ncbi:MAG: NAD/NADP octopine/nopaline dehydrogenase family protein [Thermotogota bacterium]